MPSIINALTASGGGVAITGDATGNLALQTAGNTAVTIDTSQNVGIGTATPATRLNVFSSTTNTARIRVTGTGSTNGNFRGYEFGSSGGFSGGIFQDEGTSAVSFWSTSGGESMRINSSGNLGIGGTPSTDTTYKWLNIIGPSTAGGGIVQINNSDSSVGANFFCNNLAGYLGTSTNHPFLFRINSSEVARFDTGGSLLIGTTDNAMSSGVGFKFFANASTPYCGQVQNVASGSNTYHFFNTNATNNGYRFYVNIDGGIRNYSGNNVNISDERTKENIEAAGSYLNKICSIPVKLFNYKDEPRNFGKTLGVIAQDVEKIAPEFVNNEGWLEEEQKYDTPLKSVYTTDMMFALMKCIQELKAELDATKAEVQALKGVA